MRSMKLSQLKYHKACRLYTGKACSKICTSYSSIPLVLGLGSSDQSTSSVGGRGHWSSVCSHSQSVGLSCLQQVTFISLLSLFM